MATIRPFRALRPVNHLCEAIASVPYDVVNVSEARSLAAGNPHSFLHVIRPEIDLPEGTDEYDDAVYAKGADNLGRYAESSSSIQEDSPALYVYRLTMNGREQTGLYGCVSVAEYDSNAILKHENTRPVKVKDRVRHIRAQRAHAEPVNLTYRDSNEVTRLIDDVKEHTPLYDFWAQDGVRHTIWRAQAVQPLVEAFQDVPNLYVADGHHRCQAASEALAQEGKGAPEAAFFPAVLFPMGEVHIMPYNRIVHERPHATEVLLRAIEATCAVERNTSQPAPTAPGAVCLYADGKWHHITLPPTRRATVADTLDIARLGEFVLEPHFGVVDQRSDPNIDFVGGIRGTEELERRVDASPESVAFSMYATAIEELLAVSDAGLLMPPKSTWFEPKLRSGLLVHLFG